MDERKRFNTLTRSSRTTQFWVAIIAMPFSVVGLLFVFFAWFVLSSPDVSALKGCMNTSMANVYLCPGSSGYRRLDGISPHLKNAVIASEDAMFFNHRGFDFHEIKESLAMNLKRGQYARGASTITQQLAKNVFLTSEKSLLRKMREAYLTYEIERHFSKNEIFERYLNVVEFGDQLYGINAASEYYFGKTPDHLNVLESAYLAFLLPNPKKYSESFRHGQLSPFARKMILLIVHRLQKFKKISSEVGALAQEKIDEFPWRGLNLNEPSAIPGDLAEGWRSEDSPDLDSSIWNDAPDEVPTSQTTQDSADDQENSHPKEDL